MKQPTSLRYYLAKTEPSVYSIQDLKRDKKTVWDGVRNPQAVRALMEMQPGDRVFIYHSGGVSALVGIAKVLSPGRPDPKDPKSAVVDLEFVSELDSPVTLAEVKQSKMFDDWALVRQGRLSTMPVPEKFLSWLREKFPKAGI
jgi:predicted RNA-binding protein with PUA-like domain